MKDTYFESVVMVERIHRLFLDVLKIELEKLGTHDINNVQALVLYNIGEGQLTVGELTNRGYYLGSNVSYNLRKMVQYGYVEQIQSAHDKRSSHVKLSEKGVTLYKKLDEIFKDHKKILEEKTVNIDTEEFLSTLKTLEKFWGSLLIRF